MKKNLVWIVIVAFVGVAVYLFLEQGRQPKPIAPPVAVEPPPPPAVTAPRETPEEPIGAVEPVAPLYPVEPAPSSPKEKEQPLPALDESDATLGQAVASLLGMKSLPAWVYPEKMIRRFVVTIDNLPRRKVPAEMMPVKPVAGPFVVTEGAGGRLAIDPANAARYRIYVDLAEEVEIPRLVGLYVRFYPLFQQAYVDLGYPKEYFNDRFIEAIDDLLAAPVLARPVRLVQPSVMYKYADPELETLSAGQKIMIRMGGRNAERMKTVLRALRSEVVRRGGPSAPL